MRSAVLEAVGKIAIVERAVPEPGPAEVLIKVSAVGVCGSDVHYFEHGRIGDHIVEQPLVLGHEASGIVVGFGTGARHHHLGQRVSLEPGVPDLTCPQCRAGRYNLCPDIRFFGTPPINGAFCEYVVLHQEFAHPVPDSLTDEAAALLEPLSVGVWACRKGRVGAGDRVLVNGAGPVGLVTAQTALAFGASEVVITDVNPQRLALAIELGCTHAVDVRGTALRDIGFEPNVLLECSGLPPGDAVRTVARAGRVVLVGMGGDDIPLPLPYLQEHELELTGTFRYANTWPTAIDLAATGRVDLDRLVTGHFALDQVSTALTTGRHDPGSIKPIVLPNT
ncbi:NAD(P)-dependent alcohol dehydrogenase [Nocardia anaemiae]|uniref:NAD(P)-dependent alcohol dehydrogenase n=1 Tax=Nocardia anaemiae TaxID=263910 RepID=UPI0007A545D6|nr:NAD(P)-dependent alcohol dehydrogenase [Nocardia anaemiae]